ncbi:MAG: DNA polymerase III subunit gamma/tau [Neomegalonema sp.]|nr:DNA polymerase III subunit gamma/tau [Neomegalonema sp.]
MNGREDGMSAGVLNAPSTVLARKYRPESFDQLIGQEALVRVLSNAFERDRIPHALILTGVRGVGKTTTARIVAKGLNCLTASKPTTQPCSTCDACRSIAESRHVDVLEMDAASRTGVDDIREIIESVRYRAVEARYKVYIIDETHMLSKSAFNALLKTLEEPPPHVMFILATTDIHKVPVTVLSRCMRFDLRRVGAEEMGAHLRAILTSEGAEASAEAVHLVARASEGSVRDGLSLLDQALAHGAGKIEADDVRDMLGLASRDRIFALFEHVMRGEAASALDTLAALHRDGADPVSVLKELAEACHLTTLARAAPQRLDDPTLSAIEREAASAAAAAYSVRALSRAWQMLLKAIEEAARAPSSLAAAEMALIRMTHVAELPSPDEIIKALSGEAPLGGGPSTGGPVGGGGAPGDSRSTAGDAGPTMGGAAPNGRPVAIEGGASATARVVRPEPALRGEPADAPIDGPKSFEELADYIRNRRDAKLLISLEKYARPGVVRPGYVEFTPIEGAPGDLASELGRKLSKWTNHRWIVSVADGHDAPTLDERRLAAAADLRARAEAHPLVQAAMALFQGAELKAVRDLEQPDAFGADPAFDATPPEDDDDFSALEDWDGAWEPDPEP